VTFQKKYKDLVFLQVSLYTSFNLISIFLLVKIREEEESLYRLARRWNKACRNVKCFA